MRKVYVHKTPKSPLTQGSVISGCIASEYPGKSIEGLIITPRCDLSHGIKVATVHYLPMIRYEDWVAVDGYKWMKDQLLKDCKDRLSKWLDRVTDSEDFISTTFATKNKLEELLSKNKAPDKIGHDIELYFDKNGTTIREYLRSTSTYHTKLLKSLLSNSIAPFYLIESWENIHKYYVVILREIHQISRDTADKLSSGIFADDQVEKFYESNSLMKPMPEKPYSVIYEVLATLGSPTMEHLMQRFVNNFAKIGVEDFDIDEIKSHVPNIENLI